MSLAVNWRGGSEQGVGVGAPWGVSHRLHLGARCREVLRWSAKVTMFPSCPWEHRMKEARELSADLGGAVPWGPVLEGTASHGYGMDLNVGVKSCCLTSFKALVLILWVTTSLKGVDRSIHRVA